MNDSNRTPDEHAADWKFAARVPDRARRLVVHPDGMDTMLLVADGEGAWWAVRGTCRACGDSLEPPGRDVQIPAGEVRCATCGAPHGPGVSGCDPVATMVVDDEIYLLAD